MLIEQKLKSVSKVGIGHILDTHVFGETGVLRTAVIFFYISNEGCGLPVATFAT